MAHPLSMTTPRGNKILSRILVPVDDSEHSARALRWIGTLLRDARNVQITLFHMLGRCHANAWNMAGQKFP